ncbi:MAG: hypothetical protein U0166_02360 [Acidobacteriota bacterium]
MAVGGRGRERIFRVTIALLVAASIETASTLAGLVLYGPAFFDTATVQRQRAAGAVEIAWLPGGEHHVGRRTEVLHPYAGFGLLDDRARSASGGTGFRVDPRDLSPPRTRGAFVVMVLGGSVAELLASPGSGRERLSKRLTALRPGGRVLVCNLAVAGYKEPQQLMTLAYFLINGARLDAVVNLDGFNEVVLPIVENFPSGVPLDFPRGWRSRIGSLDPENRERGAEAVGLAARRRRLAATLSRPPLSWSFTFGLIWRRWDGVLGRRIDALQLETLAHLDAGRRSRPPTPGVLAEAVKIWANSSIQLHRLCEANGIRYYHFLQPNLNVGGKPLAAEEIALIGDGSHPYRTHAIRGYPLLRAEGPRLLAAGVRFTDLTNVFEAVREPLYVDACCHLGPRGNELLADAIADAIVADVSGAGVTAGARQ